MTWMRCDSSTKNDNEGSQSSGRGYSKSCIVGRWTKNSKKNPQKSLTRCHLALPGINAQARKLQKSRSRVTSLFVDGSGEDVDGLGFWRSLSEMDLSAMGKEANRARQTALREDPEAEADKEVLRLGMEKEETESSDDNTTQYSIHPPFDFPYFLLLQGYSHRQVREGGGSTLPDYSLSNVITSLKWCRAKQLISPRSTPDIQCTLHVHQLHGYPFKLHQYILIWLEKSKDFINMK